MSLDVSLKINTCPHCDLGWEEVFEANITHNLWPMAKHAWIYEALRHPNLIKAEYARQIIDKVEKWLADMKKRPGYYRSFDASNGWGTYEDFIPWIEKYLEACKKYPQAMITTST